MPKKKLKTKRKEVKRKRIVKEKDLVALDTLNINFEKPLSEQAVRFVKEYVYSEDLDATAAAIRAGYSKATAYSKANQLKKDPRVRALIDEDTKILFEEVELRKQFLLKKLFDIVTADITNYIGIENIKKDYGGKSYKYTNLTLKDLFKLPPAQRQLIKSISQGKNGIKIELEDKIQAATLLGKHFSLYNEEDKDPGDTFNTQINIYIPDNGRDIKK